MRPSRRHNALLSDFGSWHRGFLLYKHCYTMMRSSLALARQRDVTLSDILLHLHTEMMPRYRIFSWLWAVGGAGWVWFRPLTLGTETICYALRGPSRAHARRHDATLSNLLLHLHIGMMPRVQIFSWLWPVAGVGSVRKLKSC